MSTRPAAPGKTGLFQSLRNVATSLLAMLQTRLELFGSELEIQKRTLLRLLMLALTAVIGAGLAAVTLLALITLALWEHRIAVLAVFTVLFVGITVGCAIAMRRILHQPEPPFGATLDELREDLQRLRGVAHHAPHGSASSR